MKQTLTKDRMRTSLLLTLAVMATACASTPRQGEVHTAPKEGRTASKAPKTMPPDAIARGPLPALPVVRVPGTTYAPPGTGAPVVGQPGRGGQGVPRSTGRVLPPSPYPAIYAASGDRKKPVVRGIRPKSATDKEAWEECEKRVAEAVTDPATFSEALVAKAKRLSDLNWKCAQEHAMTVCYLHMAYATKSEREFLHAASSDHGSKFRDEMSDRKKQACGEKDDDTQEVITAILERGHRYDWKTANPANLSKAFQEGPPRRQWMFDNEAANRAYREKQEKAAAARMRTITTGRTTARLPDMSGYKVPMPERVLRACWDSAQQCMNGLGADVQALPDAVYECVRWGAVNQCSRQALSAAMRATKLQGWDSPWDVLQFHKDLVDQHCPKSWDAKWDVYFDRIQNKCFKRFEAVSK